MITICLMKPGCEPFMFMYCVSDPVISVLTTFSSFCGKSGMNSRETIMTKSLFVQFANKMEKHTMIIEEEIDKILLKMKGVNGPYSYITLKGTESIVPDFETGQENL